MAQSTCSDCPYFRSYGEGERGRGNCLLFDEKSVNECHPQTQDCINTARDKEAQFEKPAATVAPKKLTYTQQVKTRFIKTMGYGHLEPEDVTVRIVKSVLQNRSSTFMEAVNLDRTGKDFWKAADEWLERHEAKKAK